MHWPLHEVQPETEHTLLELAYRHPATRHRRECC